MPKQRGDPRSPPASTIKSRATVNPSARYRSWSLLKSSEDRALHASVGVVHHAAAAAPGRHAAAVAGAARVHASHARGGTHRVVGRRRRHRAVCRIPTRPGRAHAVADASSVGARPRRAFAHPARGWLGGWTELIAAVPAVSSARTARSHGAAGHADHGTARLLRRHAGGALARLPTRPGVARRNTIANARAEHASASRGHARLACCGFRHGTHLSRHSAPCCAASRGPAPRASGCTAPRNRARARASRRARAPDVVFGAPAIITARHGNEPNQRNDDETQL